MVVPEQEVEGPLIAGSGRLLTTTDLVAVLVQPAALVTVTVYVVFVKGLTVIEAVDTPVLQAYVPPPEAVRVILEPIQTSEGPLIEADGRLLTVTV